MTSFKSINVHGNKVFYREAGPKMGEHILLLHGFPTSSHMFRNLMPLLANSYHVIAPTCLVLGSRMRQTGSNSGTPSRI